MFRPQSAFEQVYKFRGFSIEQIVGLLHVKLRRQSLNITVRRLKMKYEINANFLSLLQEQTGG